MEDMQPQASMEVVHNDLNSEVDLEQENQELKNEQRSIEQQEVVHDDGEDFLVTQETLIIRQEEIRLRIIEIQEEKKKKEKNTLKILQIIDELRKDKPSLVALHDILFSQEEFKSISEKVRKEIELNYKKHDFFDYKLVEEALEKDEFSEELESLYLEQGNNQEKIKTFEHQEEFIQENITDQESVLESDFSKIDGNSLEENVNTSFEVIKGGENISEELSTSTEAIGEQVQSTTENLSETLEVAGEGVTNAVDSLSNAA